MVLTHTDLINSSVRDGFVGGDITLDALSKFMFRIMYFRRYLGDLHKDNNIINFSFKQGFTL